MSFSTTLEKNETLTIEQDNKKYILNMKIQGEKIFIRTRRNRKYNFYKRNGIKRHKRNTRLF